MSSVSAEPRAIAVGGQIDAEAVGVLREQIAGALADGQRRIAIALDETAAVPLPAASALCRALRHACRDGATLVVTGGPPHVRRAVALCAIDGVELSAS